MRSTKKVWMFKLKKDSSEVNNLLKRKFEVMLQFWLRHIFCLRYFHIYTLIN